MALAAGAKLGAYAIVAPIGGGGMGEVYKARDERLRREVAIKTIRADYSTDKEALARFEREARALAALNHPNLVAVYDFGNEDGTAYIVSELLEGQTLRARLGEGTIPFHRALNYATQIVRALAAAHEKGFVHRDLKPENVFITNDGQVKLLDFGLAKLIGLDDAPAPDNGDESQLSTVTGRVLGTPGYMSPEQLRGLPVDARSDIFSFGAVFHEMLTHRRAFPGRSAADIISATLSKEPESPPEIASSIPPSAAMVIRHCLEKQPEDRFQSARDLLFDLEVLTTPFPPGATPLRQSVAAQTPKRRPLLWISMAVIAAAALSAVAVWLATRHRALPSFMQVTFHRSTIYEARFTADGNTVLYNASWAGNPIDIYSTRLGSTEARSLGITNADLLSVSSTGELAIVLDREGIEPWFNRGTLARMPIGGGTPKALVENVQTADWSPDGSSLAVVRHVDGQQELEFPIGKVLFRTPGWITDIRVSPKGDTIAFMEHGSQWDDRGWVSVVDLKGERRRLTGEFSSEHGMAWSPDGKEIWFSATREGEAFALHKVNLDGDERLAFRAPMNLELHDISSDGSVLLASYKDLTSVLALLPGQTTERDLSWLDQTTLFDLSEDGKHFLFQYYGEGSGPNYSSYLGNTDGSPPIRLGEDAAIALSPNGKWTVALIPESRETVLLPVGAGQVRPLPRPGIVDRGDDKWTADSQHVVFSGEEQGKPIRCYIQDISGAKPEPLGPEGLSTPRVSPDGKFLLARKGTDWVLADLSNNQVQPARGIDPADKVIRWSGDGRSVYLYRQQRIIRLFQVDPLTGHKELLREINPADPAGMIGLPEVMISADGKTCVYWFVRRISELYVARNLLQQ